MYRTFKLGFTHDSSTALLVKDFEDLLHAYRITGTRPVNEIKQEIKAVGFNFNPCALHIRVQRAIIYLT